MGKKIEDEVGKERKREGNQGILQFISDEATGQSMGKFQHVGL